MKNFISKFLFTGYVKDTYFNSRSFYSKFIYYGLFLDDSDESRTKNAAEGWINSFDKNAKQIIVDHP